jgi:tRNA(Ile)-lysidine synthase
MARETEREGVLLARPLLNVPKSQLVATLQRAKIGFADDPTNRDAGFTRPRIRILMPALAAEGGDARNLARLAARLARANAAVEILADGAERYLALRYSQSPHGGGPSFDAGRFDARIFDAKAFAAMPEEIRLRLLWRAINRFGHEGPAELGKVEALLAALDRTAAVKRPKPGRSGLKQTLAGALISLIDGRIRIEPAPARRRRAN